MLTYQAFSSNLWEAIGSSIDFLSPRCRTTQDFLLHPFHPAGLSCRLVVKPVQMQKPVHDVQLQLPHERIFKFARVTARSLYTDKNFAVLKREHVGGTR